ncbi:MATE family efflux transporter [Acrocarpospora sp. B8E8]|uniref:lipopolysaccharide biosynthesis protein n=1 Tax=Acrocarpospora sp. B8E8 TaxID=3153572 RepID=UPI00325EB087
MGEPGNNLGWGILRGRARMVVVALGPVGVLSGLVGGGLLWRAGESWVLGVVLPVVVVADVLVAATRGRGSMRETLVLGGVVQPVGQLVLVGGALVAGASVPVLVVAWALPAVPVLVLAGVRVSRDSFGSVGWGEFWRYIGPRSVASGVQAVFQRLDIVVVALLAGPAEAAMYTAATRFKVVGQLVSQGLAQAVQPRLIRAIADGDHDRAKALYRQATRTLMAITWPVWIAYAALAPWVLRLFGPSYPQGVDIALVLSATMMIATACGMVDVVLIASGRTTASLINVISAVAVTVALDIALVPSLGALGAALGWSAGVLVKNILPLVQLYGFRPRMAT